ncbi:MAG: SDR family oxidoreductase [Armatimonadota bacterium]
MILVTGATGNVGGQVVRELLARQANFRIGVRDSAKARAVLGAEVDSVPLNFDDPASVKQAFQSAQKVFLVTPGGTAGRDQALLAIEAAQESGVEHIVRLSALGADDQPGYSLGRRHREVELYLLATGMNATILRCNSFMENFSVYMGDMIREQGKFAMPLGEAKVSYIATRDIGAVAATVLTTEGYERQSYDLTGPEALTCHEVADAISRATGQNIEYLDVPEDAVRQAMAGASEEDIEDILGLYQYDRSGATARVTGTVQEITGQPPQDIRSWAMEHAQEFVGELVK